MEDTAIKVMDPVCGMKVDPARAAASVEHAGTTYYFCSPRCIEKFRAHPEQYLASKETPERGHPRT